MKDWQKGIIIAIVIILLSSFVLFQSHQPKQVAFCNEQGDNYFAMSLIYCGESKYTLYSAFVLTAIFIPIGLRMISKKQSVGTEEALTKQKEVKK